MTDWLSEVRFNEQGLVAVSAIDADDRQLLMQAWMNAEALQATIARGEMVYYSRSRRQLWHKGETSGHTQTLIALYLDCDGDSLLAEVRQKGGIACHTGRRSCFYRQFIDGQWQECLPVLKSAEVIYGK